MGEEVLMPLRILRAHSVRKLPFSVLVCKVCSTGISFFKFHFQDVIENQNSAHILRKYGKCMLKQNKMQQPKKSVTAE